MRLSHLLFHIQQLKAESTEGLISCVFLPIFRAWKHSVQIHVQLRTGLQFDGSGCRIQFTCNYFVSVLLWIWRLRLLISRIRVMIYWNELHRKWHVEQRNKFFRSTSKAQHPNDINQRNVLYDFVFDINCCLFGHNAVWVYTVHISISIATLICLLNKFAPECCGMRLHADWAKNRVRRI